jgi:glycosyltransferase involved in cell wall biosynthesis
MAPLEIWLAWITLLCVGLVRVPLCLYPKLLHYLRFFIPLLITLSWGACLTWLLLRPSIITALVLYVEFFHGINMLRMVRQQMHFTYRIKAVRRTWQSLSIMQCFILGCWFVVDKFFAYDTATYLHLLSIAQFLAAGLLLLITVSNIRRTSLPTSQRHYADTELPAVTVAIPARNETEALTIALESVVALDYPKLEIIVLDDCSQGKTADIIRSFAHDGVRFLQGTPVPTEEWLHKNWAYQQLLDTASGEYIFFMGVDIHLGENTLRQLIGILQKQKLTMMSVLPQRREARLASDLIKPLRHWWELAMPRTITRRPPVLSSAWMIQRQACQKLGGFKAIRRSVIPERYFARELWLKEQYAFYRSDKSIDLTYSKTWREQLQTALRTRYPQLHKRPELVAQAMSVLVILWLLPFVLVFFSEQQIVSGTCCIFLLTSFGLVESHTRQSAWWSGALFFPVNLVLELGLAVISMYKYEFSRIEWKGRNICLPAMHVTPSLPPLIDTAPRKKK